MPIDTISMIAKMPIATQDYWFPAILPFTFYKSRYYLKCRNRRQKTIGSDGRLSIFLEPTHQCRNREDTATADHGDYEHSRRRCLIILICSFSIIGAEQCAGGNFDALREH
jgi:hypothetical protein